MTQMIIDILVPVLGSVLTAVSIMAIRALQRRFEIQLTASEEAMLTSTVRTAIASAEEWACRKAKIDKVDAVAGSLKAARALDIIKAAYPALSNEEIVVLVDAELARAENLGASGSKVAV